MGLFGPSIRQEKVENGSRYCYGWCEECFGTGKRIEVTMHNIKGAGAPRSAKIASPKTTCSTCNGQGKRWHYIDKSHNLTDNSSITMSNGNYYVNVFKSGKPFDNNDVCYFPTDKMYGFSGSNCSHDWKFSHKGADKNYPRGHYTCTRCGTGGVQENYGSGPIRA